MSGDTSASIRRIEPKQTSHEECSRKDSPPVSFTSMPILSFTSGCKDNVCEIDRKRSAWYFAPELSVVPDGNFVSVLQGVSFSHSAKDSTRSDASRGANGRSKASRKGVLALVPEIGKVDLSPRRRRGAGSGLDTIPGEATKPVRAKDESREKATPLIASRRR